MKKFFAILVAMILVVACFAACAKTEPEETTAEETTVETVEETTEAAEETEEATEEAEEVFGDATVLAMQAPDMWYFACENDHELLKQVKAEIDAVVEEYGIDEIYVSGCSAGGFMSTRMIIDYPDLFKAAMINCPALSVADSRAGVTGATPTDEELAKLLNSPTAIWLVQGATDGTVPTDLNSVKVWNMLSEGKEVVETRFEGTAGIASGFVTKETKDGKYKLSLYDTTEEGKLVFAEDYNQDGKLERVEYSNHWSWIYTLRNNPVDAAGEHIWQWAASFKTAEKPAEPAKPQTGVNTGDAFNGGLLSAMLTACAGLAAAAWFALNRKH